VPADNDVIFCPPTNQPDFKMLEKVAKGTGARLILGAPMLHPTDSRYMVEFVTQGILKYVLEPVYVDLVWVFFQAQLVQFVVILYCFGVYREPKKDKGWLWVMSSSWPSLELK
jgi:hypothetical protein